MNRKVLYGIVLALIAALLTTFIVNALPSGPEGPIAPLSSQRWDTWGPKSTFAEAGNVTEFNTNGTSITRTWQGYFGNITGKIVLGDANNNTFYDWTLYSPQGEIYATRNDTVPNWGNVHCTTPAEIAAEDLFLNASNSLDEDSVNNTFVALGSPDQNNRFGPAELYHPTFYVANQTIAASTCPLAVMYNSTAQPSPYFKEVLLSDGAGSPVIYTGIIAHTLNPFAESDGFDKRTHDFEMIVGENGHGNDAGGSTILTTYWFYLELE